MKKLSSAILAIVMSFYGISVLSPTLAFAEDGGHNGSDTNHGSVVSAVAHTSSNTSSDSEDGNHGSTVSSVAQDNHGSTIGNNSNNESSGNGEIEAQDNNGSNHNGNNGGNDQNENENESNNNGNGGGGGVGALTISNLTASSTGMTSEDIAWNTNASADSNVYFGTSTPVVPGAFGVTKVGSTTLVTNHLVSLSSLLASTTYRYFVVSANSSGTATSTEGTFITASTTANATTNAATNVTSADATLNGMNGPTAATGHSFWVSLNPIVTTSSTIPAGVYSTPDMGAITANTAFSASLSSLTTTGVPSNLPAITPNTKYYFVAWTLVNGTWYPGSVLSFTTLANTTPPNILFATNLGLSASTESLLWVTDQLSDSSLWISTTNPVSTSTAPVAFSGTLSFFHQLSIPSLATSTKYFYTISSTDANGTGYSSGSFTTPNM